MRLGWSPGRRPRAGLGRGAGLGPGSSVSVYWAAGSGDRRRTLTFRAQKLSDPAELPLFLVGIPEKVREFPGLGSGTVVL